MQKRKHKIELYKNTMISWFILKIYVHKGNPQGLHLLYYKSEIQILFYNKPNKSIYSRVNPRLTIHVQSKDLYLRRKPLIRTNKVKHKSCVTMNLPSVYIVE